MKRKSTRALKRIRCRIRPGRAIRRALLVALAAVLPEIAVQAVNYSVSINVEGSGIVTRFPNQTLFDPGERVTLTALPNQPDIVFQSWSWSSFSAAINP